MMPDFSEYNLANTDHRVEIHRFISAFGESAVPDLIQFQMPAILIHYIECTWGTCYFTKFKELIQPHLKSAEVLNRVLRSEVIKDKGNLIIGMTGARIFPDLLRELKKCKSPEVLEYLEEEFG